MRGSFVDAIREHVYTLYLVVFYICKSWLNFFYAPRKELKGELVLLTGAAGDLGKVLSEKLAAKGCTLVLWDINKTEVEAHTKYLNEQYTKTIAYCYKCDITNQNEVNTIADHVIKTIGNPTIIINNAGLVVGRYFMDLTYEQVEKVYQVNVLSHYQIVKIFLPNMVERNHGHIVCMSSILAADGIAGVSEYCPSKAAALMFMQSLRQEVRVLGKDNVHCTTVLPFHVKATMFQGCKPLKYNIIDSLCPNYVAEKVIDAIQKNQIVLYLPRAMYFAVALLSVLPDKAKDALLDLNRINQGMFTFVGRKTAT